MIKQIKKSAKAKQERTPEQMAQLMDNLDKAREARGRTNKMDNLTEKGFYNLTLLADVYKPFGVSRGDLVGMVDGNPQIKRFKAGNLLKVRLGDIVEFTGINPLQD